MNRSKRFVYLLPGLVLLLCCSSVWAQITSSTGAIQGTVTDPQNSAVANAKVSLTNVDTGAVVSILTQSDGTFVFPLLAPGNYKIEIQAPGFESSVYEVL